LTGHLRKRFGLDENVFVVGTVGKLRREKGHSCLIRAWRKFRQKLEGPGRLIVVGDGPLRSQLEQETSDLPDVIWAGQTDDVAGFLQELDLFVFPSVNEGLGIALLEAMTHGVPVIGSDTGGIPEVVVDDETGLLFEVGDNIGLADRIEQLYLDRPRRRRLAQSAMEFAAGRFTPREYCDQVLQMHDVIGVSCCDIEIAGDAA
jgi:glycosyltransferase involved in cell wall biosynthesis